MSFLGESGPPKLPKQQAPSGGLIAPFHGAMILPKRGPELSDSRPEAMMPNGARKLAEVTQLHFGTPLTGFQPYVSRNGPLKNSSLLSSIATLLRARCSVSAVVNPQTELSVNGFSAET